MNTITDKRAAHELSKLVRMPEGVISWKDWVDAQASITLDEGDGMIDYSRTHFNRLPGHREQEAYKARLRAKRYYYVNNYQTPKAVYLYAKSKAEGQPAAA